MAERPRVIALMGPTASGKTATSIRWAKAHDGEIISVDSALVYRHLDIGSAKPTMEERAGVPHHLIDVRDPWETYSAAEFAAEAHAAIADVLARGKLPILVGGTGLYFQAVLEGLADMPEASPEIRQCLNEEAARLGWAALHARLREVDPDAAARIHATDAQRIQRALEVFEITGVPITQLQREGRAKKRSPYHVLKVIVAPGERAVLHERIALRFDQMLRDGFLDEVRRLRDMPQMKALVAPLDMPAVRAVGYRQAWQYLAGEGNEAELRDKGIAATRQLAKRQWTWLRGELDALWFDPALNEAELDGAVRRFLG